ncbi:Hypothetical_protein [Hexamita inflata]|uniref:Hypothetical_protein n=1 Tax=Hexamita inflata TaxID=28002 RepID=A0AA86PFV8_9EUKA|nr:Hypothetical protein HINF_LOCUS25031 [Hexamita inflata]
MKSIRQPVKTKIEQLLIIILNLVQQLLVLVSLPVQLDNKKHRIKLVYNIVFQKQSKSNISEYDLINKYLITWKITMYQSQNFQFMQLITSCSRYDDKGSQMSRHCHIFLILVHYCLTKLLWPGVILLIQYVYLKSECVDFHNAVCFLTYNVLDTNVASNASHTIQLQRMFLGMFSRNNFKSEMVQGVWW